VIVEIGAQLHSNCTKDKLVHNLPVAGNISWEPCLISRILDFSDFAGKKIENLDFGLYSWEKVFADFITVFESNKNGSHMVVLVILFATKFIEVQQCKKGVNFCWIFVGGIEFVFTALNYCTTIWRMDLSNLISNECGPDCPLCNS